MTGYEKFATDRMKPKKIDCLMRTCHKQLGDQVRLGFQSTWATNTPSLIQDFVMSKEEAFRLAISLLEASR